MIAFSERIKNRILNNKNKISTKYFDLKDYLINMERGQTPYTPPVCVMYELKDMLDLIKKNGGKESRLKTVKEKCEYFRNKATKNGLIIPNYPKSNMLTPLYFNDISAYELFTILKDKYQIYINPCGSELADRLFRVSHIGNTTLEDIDDLLDKLQICINELKGKNYA